MSSCAAGTASLPTTSLPGMSSQSQSPSSSRLERACAARAHAAKAHSTRHPRHRTRRQAMLRQSNRARNHPARTRRRPLPSRKHPHPSRNRKLHVKLPGEKESLLSLAHKGILLLESRAEMKRRFVPASNGMNSMHAVGPTRETKLTHAGDKRP